MPVDRSPQNPFARSPELGPKDSRRMSKAESLTSLPIAASPLSRSQNSGEKRRVVARYRHVSPIEDWLDLNAGDAVDVMDTASVQMPGWSYGKCLRTGKVGMFPDAYTRPAGPNEEFSGASGAGSSETVPKKGRDNENRESVISFTPIAPAALTTEEDHEKLLKDEARAKRRLSKKHRERGAVYADNEDGEESEDLKQRQNMGIAYSDRRASMMINREVVKQMMNDMTPSSGSKVGKGKKKKKANEESEAVPKALLYDTGCKITCPSIRKPGKSSISVRTFAALIEINNVLKVVKANLAFRLSAFSLTLSIFSFQPTQRRRRQ